MAIRGGSAGGYTTLAALTMRPGVFTAGASHFGVADLGRAGRRDAQVRVALPRRARRARGRRARDVYAERSPINHVDALDTPLAVFQGDEDAVVPPDQAEAIVAALREKGVPHAYLLFAGEQHGFRKAENIRAALDGELSFYAQVWGFDLPGRRGHRADRGGPRLSSVLRAGHSRCDRAPGPGRGLVPPQPRNQVGRPRPPDVSAGPPMTARAVGRRPPRVRRCEAPRRDRAAPRGGAGRPPRAPNGRPGRRHDIGSSESAKGWPRRGRTRKRVRPLPRTGRGRTVRVHGARGTPCHCRAGCHGRHRDGRVRTETLTRMPVGGRQVSGPDAQPVDPERSYRVAETRPSGPRHVARTVIERQPRDVCRARCRRRSRAHRVQPRRSTVGQ